MKHHDEVEMAMHKTAPGNTGIERSYSAESTEFTVAVPVAGRRYYGLGRNASYQAARTGEIPTIRIGGRLRVPVAIVERKLLEDR